MEKMQPFTPMKPMQPIQTADPWWPHELGDPSTSGSADDVRYAYFPEKRRLIIERSGKRTIFDTAEHQFRGVLQSSSAAGALSFLSQHGRVDVDSLTTV
jgi:hypothetical protein